MDRSKTAESIDTVAERRGGGVRWLTKVGRPGWFYGALIVVLSFWVLHSFLEALLVACVTAVASWSFYGRVSAALSRRLSRASISVLVTSLMAVCVLAPLLFGLFALLTETQSVLLAIASADSRGIPAPRWLQSLPLIGPRAFERWQAELAQAGALAGWAQRIDATTLLSSAGSIGQFIARQVFVVAFTILVLFFFYQEGEALADGFRRLLRHHIGKRADSYVDLTVRALRASVNSMLLVALFVGLASWAAFALAAVPHPFLWAAATGALALVPFLGYAVVGVLALHLALAGAATAAFASFALGCAVLFCGDKLVRPMIAGSGARLPFVWVLMGCLGGFEVLGLVGLVIGPVLLAITKELWEERVRDLTPTHPAAAAATVETSA